MAAAWDRLARHLTRHGYLGASGRLGPLGLALLRNLAAEWRRDVELRTGVSVVPAQLPAGAAASQLTDIAAECAALKKTLGLVPPFGVSVEATANCQLMSPDQLMAASPPDCNQLALFMVVPHKSATDWFQTLQRKRRIWWRELAADPGNYSLARPSEDAAEVRFGDELVVERLQDHGREPFTTNGKTSSARSQPHLLSCGVCVDAALWAVCRDALDGAALRLQERLAPYRRAVLADGGDSEELRALAAHLATQLRAANIPVFPLPVAPGASAPSVDKAAHFEFPSPATDATEGGRLACDGDQITPECDAAEGSAAAGVSKASGKGGRWLEAALRRADGAGVPSAVLLTESTLLDGVCRLRCRDTTLSHQLHVSQVTEVT